MRTYMTKQVTKSTIQSAKIVQENGLPVAKELPDETLLGNYNQAKAQEYIDKKYDNATVLNVEVKKYLYEMKVAEFIKYANIRKEL